MPHTFEFDPGRRTGGLRVPLAAAMLLALVVTAPVLGAAGAGRKPARPATLPDTVLARVGTSRDVTVSGFRAAWAQLSPPNRPDSLTPQSAGQFLELLIDREVLGERALKESLPWPPPESLQFRAFRDNLVLRTFLDSLMLDMSRRWMAAGDTTGDPQVLGVAVRETVLAGLAVTFDDPLAARLAERWAALPRPSSDSSMMAQLRILGTLPTVDPADTGRVLARSTAGEFRVSELVEHWRRTDPLARPRVSEASQIRDLAKNGLFEKWLRASAERARLDLRPQVIAALESRREYHSVTRLVQREVYDRLAADSLTLLRWYDAHVDEYRLPERIRLMQLVLPTRAAASEMYVQLRDEAAAETLLVRARRAGVEYRTEITAEGDSALFHAARRAGTGTVLGPDSTASGWRVARVREVIPSRRRTFDEARTFVERQYYVVEGERLMQEFLARIRKDALVTRHPDADRLAAAAP